MTEEQCQEILRKEPGDRTGIGIKNVNDRIKIYFGEEYGLTIASEPVSYTHLDVYKRQHLRYLLEASMVFINMNQNSIMIC